MMLLSVYAVAGVLFCIGALIVARFPTQYAKVLAILIFGFAVFGLFLTATTPGLYYNYDGYFGDLWTATETINKTHYGLQSSVDYFNPIGPVYSLVYALLLVFEPEPTVATVVHASALAAGLAAGLGVIIVWKHVSLLGLAIVTLSIVGVAVSGRGNGEILNDMPMHYLAPYNRWAWALFLPVVVRLALPFKRDQLGDVALGLAIALLLLLKVTYGAAALGLLAARLVILPGAWRQLPFTILGLAVVLLGLELATGQLSAHLRDLALTATLPESGLRIPKLFGQLGEMALFCAVALIAYFGTLQKNVSWSDIRPVLFILLVAGAGCAVLMQNHYAVEAAVYPLLLLIALEWTKRLNARKEGANLQERTLIAGAVAAIVFFPVIDISMHVGQRVQFATNAPDPSFGGTPYANLRFEPYLVASSDSKLNSVADGYAGTVEGLNMLRAAGADLPGAGTVVALNFANPFPMLLNQPSPKGTPIWLHEGRTFSDETFVAPDVLFEGVGYVMHVTNETALWSIYQSVLESEFSVASQGDHWTLLTRK